MNFGRLIYTVFIVFVFGMTAGLSIVGYPAQAQAPTTGSSQPEPQQQSPPSKDDVVAACNDDRNKYELRVVVGDKPILELQQAVQMRVEGIGHQDDLIAKQIAAVKKDLAEHAHFEQTAVQYRQTAQINVERNIEDCLQKYLDLLTFFDSESMRLAQQQIDQERQTWAKELLATTPPAAQPGLNPPVQAPNGSTESQSSAPSPLTKEDVIAACSVDLQTQRVFESITRTSQGGYEGRPILDLQRAVQIRIAALTGSTHQEDPITRLIAGFRDSVADASKASVSLFGQAQTLARERADCFQKYLALLISFDDVSMKLAQQQIAQDAATAAEQQRQATQEANEKAAATAAEAQQLADPKLMSLKSLQLVRAYPDKKSLTFDNGEVKELGRFDSVNGKPEPSPGVTCNVVLDVCLITTVRREFKVEPVNIEKFVADVISTLRPENSEKDFLTLADQLQKARPDLQQMVGSIKDNDSLIKFRSFEEKQKEVYQKAEQDCLKVLQTENDASGCFAANSGLDLLNTLDACNLNRFDVGPPGELQGISWCFIDKHFGILLAIDKLDTDRTGKLEVAVTIRAPLVDLEINAMENKMELERQQGSYNPPRL